MFDRCRERYWVISWWKGTSVEPEVYGPLCLLNAKRRHKEAIEEGCESILMRQLARHIPTTLQQAARLETLAAQDTPEKREGTYWELEPINDGPAYNVPVEDLTPGKEATPDERDG